MVKELIQTIIMIFKWLTMGSRNVIMISYSSLFSKPICIRDSLTRVMKLIRFTMNSACFTNQTILKKF